jgi:TrpR family trp operon transcriptional repressor
MSLTPEFSDWQQLMSLIQQAAEKDQHEMLLSMVMTADERESMLTRVNILNELLKGDISQRQISQMLGVGVATITRGSNELKSRSDSEVADLLALLRANAQSNAGSK